MRGAKSYDREKALPSINYSVLSECYPIVFKMVSGKRHSNARFTMRLQILCKSKSIRPREGLALYKSFISLWEISFCIKNGLRQGAFSC